jgi:hypothetical protein
MKPLAGNLDVQIGWAIYMTNTGGLIVSPYTGYPPILLLRQHSCVLSILPVATDNYLTAQAVFGCNVLRELDMGPSSPYFSDHLVSDGGAQRLKI